MQSASKSAHVRYTAALIRGNGMQFMGYTIQCEREAIYTALHAKQQWFAESHNFVMFCGLDFANTQPCIGGHL